MWRMDQGGTRLEPETVNWLFFHLGKNHYRSARGKEARMDRIWQLISCDNGERGEESG